MMRAQLPWLIAWWLDRGFPLVTFPHHWLTESGRSTPVERTESGHVRIDGPSGRDEPLKGFYQSHCLRLLPALLERAFAPGDSAVAKRAAAERGPLERLLGLPLSQLLRRREPDGKDLTGVASAPVGAIVQVLGSTLPLRWTAREQLGERAHWEDLAGYLEKLLQAAAAEEAPAEVAALRKAAEALAHAAGLADATAMMCDIPGRVLDLVLVLHYAHRAPARDRLHRHAAPSSMLPTLELLTAAPNGLLPPRLAPPPTVDSQKQGLFPSWPSRGYCAT
ncbi:hypothetical protein Ctob_011512 [Chrysochromulina tobinii]|uniref:Uncharacterized protein n=1 Tax=Chrysochromulina tobinii TaxID=1460289 RepID=A0A0M0K8T5_9EUKA|nr:hypothetical protein Ctob_011512 [Chrysochromulina tobinii]|eukprot:KOO35240.1 hypothetical protein Ctob_011512 [Chrysochromulina sp. CCMP291]